MRKIFNRIIIFFCILALSLCVVFLAFKPVKTQASVIAVGGAVIAALSAFMAASGIEITTSGIEAGDLGTIWENISHDFSYDNKALTDWYGDGNAVNFLMGKDNADKTVLLSASFASWLNEFKAWLVSNFGITSSGAIITSRSGLTCYDGQLLLAMSSLSGDLRNFNLVNVNSSGSSFYYQVTESYGFGGTVTDVTGHNNFVMVINNNGSLTQKSFPLGPGGYNYANVGIICTSPTFNQGFPANALVCLGLNADGSYKALYSTLIRGIPLSGLETSGISVSGELTEGYSDFEQALEDAQTDAGENGKIAVGVGDITVPIPVTQENLVDGILDSAAENTLSGELVGGYENEKEAEEENNAERVPTVGDFESGVVIVDGLEDFFPFCIPFDLYALVEKFNVPAKAPKISYTMSFANKFEAETIELDFAPWENAARIFRVLIVIGFAIFLILKTRDLIRG